MQVDFFFFWKITVCCLVLLDAMRTVRILCTIAIPVLARMLS